MRAFLLGDFGARPPYIANNTQLHGMPYRGLPKGEQSVLAWKRAARIGERRRGSVNFRAWWPSRRKAATEQPLPIAETDKPTIALIGGTGALGSGLARRWATAGYTVVIGSREAAKARALAATLDAARGATSPSGAGNLEAAARADIIMLTVPYADQETTLESIRPNLRGKLVLSSAVPLSPDAAGSVVSGSLCAAMDLQRGLGAEARAVSAFHNVPARRLDGARAASTATCWFSGTISATAKR